MEEQRRQQILSDLHEKNSFDIITYLPMDEKIEITNDLIAMEVAINNNSRSFQWASEKLMKNTDFVADCIEMDVQNIRFVTPELYANIDFIKKAKSAVGNYFKRLIKDHLEDDQSLSGREIFSKDCATACKNIVKNLDETHNKALHCEFKVDSALTEIDTLTK